MKIRTRFSPSPTGLIHLGNARAALFSALFAKKNDGVFVLRIEDTDATRSELHYIETLQDDLHWLNVNWQEGPGMDGQYGPYMQSARQDIYAKYYQVLEEKKLIYPCFCTDTELAVARKLYLSRGQAPRYSGRCRNLEKHEIDAKIAAGEKPAWRFKVPSSKNIEFTDCVKGLQQFNSEDIGDFIVRRADGTAPFLFCNAVDDATMAITHVLRGEDHLANTPRQIMILDSLKLPVPQYGHLSLILGDDGAPLSKRHGSFNLNGMREEGFLPLAIMNYLARLGHTMESMELMNFSQLAEHFTLTKLSRSAAKFDLSQLLFWQKHALQKLQLPELSSWIGEKVLQQIPTEKKLTFLENIRANIIFPVDAAMWAEIFFSNEIPLTDDDKLILQNAGEQFFVEAEEAVNKYGLNLKLILDEMKTKLNVNGKKLFMPLRVALTGRQHGPELAQIAALLGQEKMQLRLSEAFKLASSK